MSNHQNRDANDASGAPKRKALTAALQHPLATMLSGFLLTPADDRGELPLT